MSILVSPLAARQLSCSRIVEAFAAVRSFDDVRLSGIERGVMGELCTVASSEAKLRSLAKNCLGGGASYNH